jgi:hypothetical protein
LDAYGEEADISQPIITAETVENDPGHWPVNDPESGDGVRRRKARWRQDLALFIGAACYQKRQRTKLFRACELKPIAIQWVRPNTVHGMNLD